MKKKVLITGGTGFLGSTFIRKYSGHYEFLNISRDPADLDKIKDFKPEFLIHLAANATTNVSDVIRTNIEFATIVLDKFVDAGGKKVLNIGSYWEHMNNLPYSPNTLYASTKKAFEDIIQFYVDVKNIEAMTLKLFDNYGKNDPRKKILRLVFDAHKNSAPLDLSGGEQLLNLLHAEDIADAFHAALSKIKKGHEFYLVKAEQTLTLKEIVNAFCEVNNLSPVLNWGKRPYGPNEFFKDVTVHPVLPDWKPKISMREGLKGIYQD